MQQSVTKSAIEIFIIFIALLVKSDLQEPQPRVHEFPEKPSRSEFLYQSTHFRFDSAMACTKYLDFKYGTPCPVYDLSNCLDSSIPITCRIISNRLQFPCWRYICPEIKVK